MTAGRRLSGGRRTGEEAGRAEPGLGFTGALTAAAMVVAPSPDSPTSLCAGLPRPPRPPNVLGTGYSAMVERAIEDVSPPGQFGEPAEAFAGSFASHSSRSRSLSMAQIRFELPATNANERNPR